MVDLTALWLPILLSAVAVFGASFVLHMVLPFHWKDYAPLPGEDDVRAAMRNAGVGPGNYAVPCPASPKEMGSPEVIAKYEEGPIAFINVMPSGAPKMGKSLTRWFIFSVIMGVFVAYLVGLTVAAGSEYRTVFRLASTVAFLGYVGAEPLNAIWKGQSWSTSVRHGFDGLVYALLTAGIFGWLWPDA